MSAATCGETLDPHVAALMRATKTDEQQRSRGADASELCFAAGLPGNGRAQGVPDAGRTREPCVQRSALCARKKSQGSRNTRHSLRNGFTAYTWSPRCTGLFGHRRLALVTQDLIPASGDRDRTISPYATRASSCARRVHRIPPPTSVTIASRPSCGSGMTGNNHIFPKNGSRIFLRRGLDTSADRFR